MWITLAAPVRRRSLAAAASAAELDGCGAPQLPGSQRPIGRAQSRAVPPPAGARQTPMPPGGARRPGPAPSGHAPPEGMPARGLLRRSPASQVGAQPVKIVICAGAVTVDAERVLCQSSGEM